MKRTMALAAAVGMLTLFALAGQAAAQGQPTASVDPEYVGAAGDHTVTISGSGWQADPAVTACPGFGGAIPAPLDQGAALANCPDLIADMGATVSAPGGSFSTSRTLSVPAEGLVILVFTAEPSAADLAVVKVGEPMGDMDDMDDMDGDMDDMDDMDGDMDDMDDMDGDMDDMGDMGDMGDDMAPEGGAATGFGGTAGSDGNSVAVPLAATLAAVVLLGGTALAVRRHS